MEECKIMARAAEKLWLELIVAKGIRARSWLVLNIGGKREILCAKISSLRNGY